MGFDFLDFLGGVAEGASKTLEQQMEAQKEAIKESSSAAIRQRLANRQKHTEKINAVKEEVLPLLNSYNIEDVAYLMKLPKSERDNIIKKLEPIRGKEAKGAMFKGIKQFQNKIPNITPSKLINSLVPAYQESKLDVSGLIPKTFADVLFGTDPSEKLTKAIERGAPADKTLETDRIVGLSNVPNYYGLSKQGRLLVDTKAPKDTYQFTQRGIIKSLHTLLGGTGTYDETSQQYIPESAEDTFINVATQVGSIYTPIYAQKVRELQLEDPSLGLIAAQAKAQQFILADINKKFRQKGVKADSLTAMQNFIKGNTGVSTLSQSQINTNKILQNFQTDITSWISSNKGNSAPEKNFGELFPEYFMTEVLKQYDGNALDTLDKLTKFKIRLNKIARAINRNATTQQITQFQDMILNRMKQLGMISGTMLSN